MEIRACNPESQSRDPGIHFKSQSRDFELIGISGLRISSFCIILALFWSFLGIFWLVELIKFLMILNYHFMCQNDNKIGICERLNAS